MQASPTCLIRLFVLTAAVFGTSYTYAEPAADNVTTTARVTVRGNEVKEFDWAKLQARARIAYVSSGPRALRSRMIDNDLQTEFRFSESDPSPLVIIELAKSAQVHRVSTVFKAEDARVDVFLLNELPKNMADLQFANPDASVVTLPDERGLVTVNLSVGSTRYVALRWKRTKRDDPFTVAEISAFSNDPAESVTDHGPDVAQSTNLMASAPPTLGVISP
ncbi:MAG TPA: hypothetical protein VKS98_10840 [Chthoniobacterales bacterium]|nr:hypothetical protein [Chthoniobacterales bacterium]